MAFEKIMKSSLSFVLLTALILSPVFACAADAPPKTPVTRSASMQYDVLNRLTNIWYSNGFRETFRYDPAGNLVLRQSFGPPLVSGVSNLVILAGHKRKIPFVVAHSVLPITNILVKALSSSPSLLGTNTPPVVGMGTNRYIEVLPSGGVIGETTISLVASDGFVNVTNRFTVVVKPDRP